MSLHIRYVGHATFELWEDGGLSVVIDPFYTGNPRAHGQAPEKVDYVLLTHDHADHVGDMPSLVKKGAKLLTQPETAARYQREASLPQDRLIGMNIGGTYQLAEGIRATMIPALHTSETGAPSGYRIHWKGITLMHLGDTGYFSDLAYWAGDGVDLALVPIGDHFTMGPQQAAKAVALIKPKKVIPMHYATFPILIQDPKPFVEAVEKEAPQTEVAVLSPGDEITL
ncbi:MAG: metal-dependent hydrolase [Clostridiales bacterium]|nr:metal-dependent hydrolase [Clostridiales bacterium]